MLHRYTGMNQDEMVSLLAFCCLESIDVSDHFHINLLFRLLLRRRLPQQMHPATHSATFSSIPPTTTSAGTCTSLPVSASHSSLARSH